MAIYRLTTVDAEIAIFSKDNPPRWGFADDYIEGNSHRIAIVRASGEPDARATAAAESGCEGGKPWLDESTTVERILAGPSELLGTL